MEFQRKKHDKDNNSFYLISDDYIPVLIKKNLFHDPKKAVKIIDNIKIPSYEINNFDASYIKKSPNAFILYRNDIYKKVKKQYPESSSRKISIIIGKMWKQLNEKEKLSYKLKTNKLYKNNYNKSYKYKKFLSNIKQRKYIKLKEQCVNYNSYIQSIKKLLFND